MRAVSLTAVGVFTVFAIAMSSSARGGLVVRSSEAAGRRPARVISTAGADVLPHLVVAPDGRGFVALSGPHADVVGARIAADGAIGRPQLVAPAAEDPRRVGLGISSRGTVSAAYTSGSGRRSRVLFREGAPGRAFGSPLHISPAGVTATLVTFRETPDGFGVALLCLGNQRRCTYAFYAHARGGRFRNVTDLPTGATHAAIGVAPDHGVIAVWEARRRDGSHYVQGMDWRGGRRPTAPYTVAGHIHPGWYWAPQVGIVAGGGAVVVWGVPLPGGRGAVEATDRGSVWTRFSVATTLTNEGGGHDTGEFRLSTQAGVVLLSTSEAARRGRYRAVLRTWTAAYGFGRRQIVSPASRDAFDPFAAAGGGRTVLAWDGGRDGDSIEAATAPFGGSFGAPAALSDPRLIVQSGSGPFLSVDRRGVALAVWIDYGGPADSPGQLELARLVR
jgi:hypothetical protein